MKSLGMMILIYIFVAVFAPLLAPYGQNEIVDFEFEHGGVLHRHARVMHRLWIARDQRMPVRQRLSGPEQFVGAGFRDPIEVGVHILGAEHDAFGYELVADVVLAAAAGFIVEQAAGDAGQCDLFGVFIFTLLFHNVAPIFLSRS